MEAKESKKHLCACGCAKEPKGARSRYYPGTTEISKPSSFACLERGTVALVSG